MFKIQNLSAKYGNKTVFSNIDFELPEHSLTALCGINGCGKSTLLSLMAGIKPDGLSTDGSILLSDADSPSQPLKIISNDLRAQSAKIISKNISLLVQNETHAWDISVRDFIFDGRFTHHTWLDGVFGSHNTLQNDNEILEKAVSALKLQNLLQRLVSTLSGGELQRVRIARSLVQQTKYLFLDEPLNALDINHQKELIDLLKELCTQGKTVCLSIHDINLACLTADTILMMKKDRSGCIFGSVSQLINNDVLPQIFGSSFQIFSHPITGTPQIW